MPRTRFAMSAALWLATLAAVVIVGYLALLMTLFVGLGCEFSESETCQYSIWGEVYVFATPLVGAAMIGLLVAATFAVTSAKAGNLTWDLPVRRYLPPIALGIAWYAPTAVAVQGL